MADTLVENAENAPPDGEGGDALRVQLRTRPVHLHARDGWRVPCRADASCVS